jgi:hypothetical protein
LLSEVKCLSQRIGDPCAKIGGSGEGPADEVMIVAFEDGNATEKVEIHLNEA